MREIDRIICLLKSVRESQSVIASAETVTLTFETVLMVANVLADTMPGELFGAVSGYLGEAEHAHAVVVERVGLGKVKDVELYLVILASISHSEEEPLSVAVCVDIILKDQVIL